jgi:hypothetical protein
LDPVPDPDKLVSPAIEPGPLDLYPGALTTRPRGPSIIIIITTTTTIIIIVIIIIIIIITLKKKKKTKSEDIFITGRGGL